jgi:hypothetical protein
MNQNLIFQLGSLLGKTIPLAMGLVAIAAGWIMVFDAIRMYRNQATKVTSPDPSEESPADMLVNPSPLARHSLGGGGHPRRAKALYPCSQARKHRA